MRSARAPGATRLRAACVVALAVAAGLAGCAKEEAPVEAQAIAPGLLAGVVTDVALVPLAGASIRVEGTNLTAQTDASGAFAIEALPGEYVVLAAAPEHKPGALRASVLPAQTATLAFQLEAVPKIVPRVDVAEASGYLACGALVVTAGDAHALPCGAQDPNERDAVEFPLGATEGLEALVLEVAWEARTSAAEALRVDLSLASGESDVALGGTQGPSPLAIVLPARLLSPGTLVVRVGPAGSFADEEAGTDAGLALQQPFTAYASAFHHHAPPAGYSARSG